MAKFMRTRQIGEGGFAEIWECKRLSDGQVFAMKLLRLVNHLHTALGWSIAASMRASLTERS